MTQASASEFVGVQAGASEFVGVTKTQYCDPAQPLPSGIGHMRVLV